MAPVASVQCPQEMPGLCVPLAALPPCRGSQNNVCKHGHTEQKRMSTPSFRPKSQRNECISRLAFLIASFWSSLASCSEVVSAVVDCTGTHH